MFCFEGGPVCGGRFGVVNYIPLIYASTSTAAATAFSRIQIPIIRQCTDNHKSFFTNQGPFMPLRENEIGSFVQTHIALDGSYTALNSTFV